MRDFAEFIELLKKDTLPTLSVTRVLDFTKERERSKALLKPHRVKPSVPH